VEGAEGTWGPVDQCVVVGFLLDGGLAVGTRVDLLAVDWNALGGLSAGQHEAWLALIYLEEETGPKHCWNGEALSYSGVVENNYGTAHVVLALHLNRPWNHSHTY